MAEKINVMAGFTDWQEPMEKLFELAPIKHMVEFGLGSGTKWFADRCDLVHSVEFVANPSHLEWVDTMEEELKDYANWEVETIITEDAYTEAVQDAIDSLRSYDFAFVDPGIHCRGKIVQQLFGRVPIIAAHDTNLDSDDYEYKQITVPKDYNVYHYNNGQGVTFWIKDKTIAEELQKHYEN